MRFDAINPASMLPNQPTEGGTPILSQIPFDPAMVVPMPNLPDDASRPEDKHSKNEQEKLNPDDINAKKTLPEIFQLLAGFDFSELFRFYFFIYDGDTWFLQKKWRELLGIKEFDPIPHAMKKSSHVHEQRTDLYNFTIFYHGAKPGQRFTGSM